MDAVRLPESVSKRKTCLPHTALLITQQRSSSVVSRVHRAAEYGCDAMAGTLIDVREQRRRRDWRSIAMHFVMQTIDFPLDHRNGTLLADP